MAEYTAVTPDGKFLLHYGVKGMKWGKNKSKKSYETQSQSRLSGTKSNTHVSYTNLTLPTILRV